MVTGWAVPFILFVLSIIGAGIAVSVLDRLDRRRNRRPELRLIHGGARAVCDRSSERGSGGAA